MMFPVLFLVLAVSAQRVYLNCSSSGVCSANNVAACNCFAVESLQRLHFSYFDGWPSMSLWQIGNGVETLVNYQNRSSLSERCTVGAIAAIVSDLYPWERLLVQDFSSYDDLLWWSLAYIRLFEQTGVGSHLETAQIVFDFVYRFAWDTRWCGGGFWWSDAYAYKNAVTNALGIVTSSKLHVYIDSTAGNNHYGDIADTALRWFLNSGMLSPKTDLIWDGMKIHRHNNTCIHNHGPPFTYNQGVILLGLKLAADRQRQNNKTYLATIERIFDGVATHLCDDNGVLHEAPPVALVEDADSDDQTFKGIFVRYVSYVVDAMPSAVQQRMRRFLRVQADSVLRADRTTQDTYGFFWQGPILKEFNQPSCATQFSVIDLFNANVPK